MERRTTSLWLGLDAATVVAADCPSAEEYPGPDCVLVWQALDLGEKRNYNIVSQHHMHKGT